LLLLYSIFSIGNDSTLINEGKTLRLIQNITGGIAPKSIGFNGNGLFFAQNMMYKHTCTVYNRTFEKVATIKDGVYLEKFGEEEIKGFYRGSPVEITFSENGKYAWVSNYQMYGDSLKNPGCDGCSHSSKYDKSYVYKINTQTFEIEKIIKVGSVPKYLIVAGDYLIVSNWSSADVSIIDLTKEEVVKTIRVGRFPRGLAYDSLNKNVYVALMGESNIAKINLSTFEKVKISNIGRKPRHICISKDYNHLFISLNDEGKVVKFDVDNEQVTEAVHTGKHPRSMQLSKDGKYLYVVNYFSDKLSKIATSTMTVVEEFKTASKPIGIDVDTLNGNIWIACYSGKIQVLKDSYYETEHPFSDDFFILATNQSDSLYFNDFSGTIAIKKERNQLTASKDLAIKTKSTPISNSQPTRTPKPTTNNKELEVTYHIIIGSFKIKQNAERLSAENSINYEATVVPREDGFYMVSSYSSKKLADAEVNLNKIRQSVNQSAWIYEEKNSSN